MVTKPESVVGLGAGLLAELPVALVKVSMLLFALSVSSLEDLKWKQRDRQEYKLCQCCMILTRALIL